MENNTNISYVDSNESDFSCEIVHENNPIKSPYFRITVYTAYAIIVLVSVIGNGFVCFIVLSCPRMRTVTNYFITNLAVGDLLITILCVPSTAFALLEQYWPFGSVLCTIASYSQCISVFVSAYTLVAISIDKYMIIMWPLRPRISKRFAVSVIAIVWLIAALTVLPTAMYSELVQPNETIYKNCDKYICKENYGNPEFDWMYSQILMLLQYIIPAAVLLFTYTRIGIVIWCHRIPGEAENSRDQRIARSKIKMIKMMVTVVFVYTLCWLPYNLFLVMQSSISNKILPYIFFSLHALAMSHACYNPIIYCYMNTRFRTGFLQTMGSIPGLRACLISHLLHQSSSTYGGPTGIEGTESTTLQRNNTCTTYISMKRKNCTRINSCTHQLPIRSASLMTNSGNNQHMVKRTRYYGNIMDEQI